MPSDEYRILVTGSREWADGAELRDWLSDEVFYAGWIARRPVLIHGDAEGADAMADAYFRRHVLNGRVEAYPAAPFNSPLDRNIFMVGLGADVCVTFALEWGSGTGHCARAARRADIPVIDCGVSTE